jgi:hypothetical protein
VGDAGRHGRAAHTSRQAKQVLYLFLSLDLFFIAFHVLVSATRLAGFIEGELPASLKLFSVINDRGLPEFCNQVKALLAAAFLTATWAKTKQMVYLCWVLVFAAAALDDAFLIHERAGDAFYRAFVHDSLGERGIFVGGVMFAGVYAAAFGSALWIAHAFADRQHARNSLIILFFFGIVVFFAIFVDGLHGLVVAILPELKASVVFQGLTNLFEDGGELLSLSLALAAVIAVHEAVMRRSPPSPPAPQRTGASG